MDKAEILEVIIDWHIKHQEDNSSKDFIEAEQFKILASSLTSLIIKWLEGKRVDGAKYYNGKDFVLSNDKEIGRNQLITELIGEVK